MKFALIVFLLMVLLKDSNGNDERVMARMRSVRSIPIMARRVGWIRRFLP